MTGDITAEVRSLLDDDAAFTAANVAAIAQALAGRGPDDAHTTPPADASGICMAVNMAAAHVPAFCQASCDSDPRPYKNGYDLDHYRVGDPPPGRAYKARERVDAALEGATHTPPSDLYFGAAELNGTGIYFYGDQCLVLHAVDKNTPILRSNSYDLVRSPLREVIEHGPPSSWDRNREQAAVTLAGRWAPDLTAFATRKILDIVGPRRRRLTTGQISAALLVDEDYIEVLRPQSFAATDLTEVRVRAEDAAAEAHIADRMRFGPPPPLADLLWRQDRRAAEHALQNSAVRTRVVTTGGRTKG